MISLRKICFRLIVLILLLVLCADFTLQPSATEITGKYEIVAESVTGDPGDTVVVHVTIDNNEGFAGFKCFINYDNEALTLKKIQKGEVLSASGIGYNLQENVVIWFNSSNCEGNGTMLTLTFEIAENASEPSYPISLDIVEFFWVDDVGDFYDITPITVDGEVEINGVVDPDYISCSIKATSATLLYEDMIQVRYKFQVTASDPSDIVSYGMYIFTSQADAETCDAAKAIQDKELSGTGGVYYGYTDGVPAKEMGDSQFVVGYLKLANGEYVYGNIVEYSPKIYAARMVGKDSTKPETKLLCKALMHYGAAAQMYFNYKTDDLMNEGFAAVEFDATVMGESVFAVDTTPTNGFTTKSATLLFEGAITYRVKYTASSEIAGKTLYAEYTFKGETYSLELELIDGAYYAYIDGIAAKDLDEVLTVKPYYVDESGSKVYGAELVYSGYEYARRTIDTSSKPLSVALAKALAMYIDAADKAI